MQAVTSLDQGVPCNVHGIVPNKSAARSREISENCNDSDQPGAQQALNGMLFDHANLVMPQFETSRRVSLVGAG